jgi:hypothetical protein
MSEHSKTKTIWLVKSMSNDKRRLHISLSSPLSSETYSWLLVSKLTTCVTSQALNWEIIFFPIKVFSSLSPCWFFIHGGEWRKPPRKVSYNRTFGVPDQGQMLGVWESQTTESALRWQMRHITPHNILELTHEVILEHVLGIKTMTWIESLILDHVARAYLYLGICTGEKVMILFLSHSLGVVIEQNKT